MTSGQGSASGLSGRRSTTFPLGYRLFVTVLASGLACFLAFFLSACAGLPKPEKPEPPSILLPCDSLAELPWVKAYPAPWYGNSQAACSITFDDGTLDQYLLAAPELDTRGIKGTFFIVTGPRAEGVWTDGTLDRQLFSWEQARELQSRGHEIASHTATHVDLKAHPQLAEAEISRAYDSLTKELSQPILFSFGWPYWRSSLEAKEQVRRFHYAARAGGIKGSNGSPGLGGTNGKALDDYLMIGSRAILSTESLETLAPVFDEVHGSGGWFVPSFHGIDDGQVPARALGWEALNLDTFRTLLDGLAAYGFWFAPFGDVARYAMQRDELQLEILRDGTLTRIYYSSGLDSSIFDQNLTLVIKIPLAYRLESITEAASGDLLAFQLDGKGFSKCYLVELRPGNGVLFIQAYRESP